MVALVRVHRAPDVVHRMIDGEAVLLDLKSGRYFGLNPTGALVWERLGNSGATAEDLKSALVERFDVDDRVAGVDLEELLESLERNGLVTRGS